MRVKRAEIYPTQSGQIGVRYFDEAGQATENKFHIGAGFEGMDEAAASLLCYVHAMHGPVPVDV